jgi:hypothetical protein
MPPSRELLSGPAMSWMNKRWSAVLAGVLLVLVPTLFSVFTEWTRWSVGVRIAVLAVWVIVAAFVVAGSALQSEQIKELVGRPLRRRELARQAAAHRLIHALLAPPATPLLGNYEFALYLPNKRRTRLLPEYRSAAEPDEGWDIGNDSIHGITGAAWSSNGYTAERGEKVSDSTYGLTPAQQARYAHLTGVAACPVQNARLEPIGVLTVSTSDVDPPVYAKEFVEAVIGTAQIAARILIDIARVATD